MMSMSPIRSWADLRRLSPVLCRYLGISDAVYHQVVETMGPLLASVALSLTLEKTERQEVMSPGGYLRALTHRAGTGDMHLHRTIRAILRRNSRAVTL
jgi:replication initiation protein RepC